MVTNFKIKILRPAGCSVGKVRLSSWVRAGKFEVLGPQRLAATAAAAVIVVCSQVGAQPREASAVVSTDASLEVSSPPQSSRKVSEPPAAISEKAAARDRRAHELYVLGDRLYAEGNYEAAVTAFEVAYELSQRAQLLFNIANALERLGRYDEARSRLGEYVPHAPEAQREALRRRMLSLDVRARQRRQELLARVEREVAKAAASSSTQPVPTTQPLSAMPQPVEADGTSTPVLGYSLLGVGAAGIAVGAVFGVLANSDHSEAEEQCATNGDRRLCPVSARTALDNERSNAGLADLSIGIGVAAAAVGAYLVLTNDVGEELSRLQALPTTQGWRVNIVTAF